MNEGRLTKEENRRALEALRNGVPNRDAVRVLGCGQEAVVERFLQQLEAVEHPEDDKKQAQGTIVAGDFGSGKSHLLQYLRHLALDKNFVCSLVVISKETPLYDPAKLYLAAVEAAAVTGTTGNAIQEISLHLKQDQPKYAEFFKWADREDNGIARVFPATLLLHERLGNDPGMCDRIRGFWAGERIPISEVRAGMKQIRMSSTYVLRTVPAKELASQRFRFAARLMQAAGYRGWVLLVDEVELVGRYSRAQRGKSYAELARLMGRVETDHFAGITTVAAITSDFGQAVLSEKGDLDGMQAFFESKDSEEYRLLASRAVTGMRIIGRDTIPLKPPDADTLDRTREKLKQIHAQAYSWTPQEVSSAPQDSSRRMRSYVRRWINEWDLQRLYPGQIADTVESEIKMDYTESPELQQESEESAAEPIGGE